MWMESGSSNEHAVHYTWPHFKWSIPHVSRICVFCIAYPFKSLAYCLSFMKYRFYASISSHSQLVTVNISLSNVAADTIYLFYVIFSSPAHAISSEFVHICLRSLVAACWKTHISAADFPWLQMCVRRSYIIEFHHVWTTECCSETETPEEKKSFCKTQFEWSSEKSIVRALLAAMKFDIVLQSTLKPTDDCVNTNHCLGTNCHGILDQLKLDRQVTRH